MEDGGRVTHVFSKHGKNNKYIFNFFFTHLYILNAQCT